MKKYFTFANRFSPVLLTAALLGAGTFPGQAALPLLPLLTNGVAGWDCTVTGPNGQSGIMFINFTTNLDAYGNFTFNNLLFQTKVTPGSLTTNPRGSGSDSRGDTPSSTGFTNLYQLTAQSGSWIQDTQHSTVYGFFIELSPAASGTNYITNQVSFVAKITANKRFTAMYSSSLGGSGKYSGVPIKTNLVDLSGSWLGTEKLGGVSSYEFFTLTPYLGYGFPNVYNINGSGPGYSLSGGSRCLLSVSKKIGFVDIKSTSPTNFSLRITAGTLTGGSTAPASSTKGLASPGTNVSYRVSRVSP